MRGLENLLRLQYQRPTSRQTCSQAYGGASKYSSTAQHSAAQSSAARHRVAVKQHAPSASASMASGPRKPMASSTRSASMTWQQGGGGGGVRYAGWLSCSWEPQGREAQEPCLAAGWHRQPKAQGQSSGPDCPAFRHPPPLPPPPTRSLPGISTNLGGPPFSDGCHSTLTSSSPCCRGGWGKGGGQQGQRILQSARQWGIQIRKQHLGTRRRNSDD